MTDVAFKSFTPEGVAEAVRAAIPRIATQTRPDFMDALREAAARETGERARSVLTMMIDNDDIARRDHVPICQDTGSVWVYLEAGPDCNVPGNIFTLVDDAVAGAYEDARLRMSILSDALVERENAGTNAPAFTELGFSNRPGARLHVMLKGGGSDNASRVVMLPPGAGYEGIEDAVISCVREKGSSACPPLLVGIGVGTTFDKVGGLAKKALLRPVGERSADNRVAKLEERLLHAVNATGVGPAGLGGDTTALDVHINTAPCHIAALPVAINMGCCAMRSISLELEEA